VQENTNGGFDPGSSWIYQHCFKKMWNDYVRGCIATIWLSFGSALGQLESLL